MHDDDVITGPHRFTINLDGAYPAFRIVALMMALDVAIQQSLELEPSDNLYNIGWDKGDKLQ